ncbi:MAG: VPLPA-CTERM sorting domain-containing protein [Gammaproteobacteria bacterium]
MRISYKLGFLAAAALAGTNAFASIAAPQTGNGELILFVQDVNTPTNVYARGLGIFINDVMTTAEAASGTYSDDPTLFSKNIAGVSADATLSTFLSGGSSYVWTVMAGDSTVAGSAALAGERRYVTTLDPNLISAPLNLNNGQLATAFANLNGTVVAANGNPFSATNSTAPNGQWGTDTSESWYSAAVPNGNLLPTSGTAASTLFVIANSGNSNSGAARVWQLSTDVTMDAQGNLSFGATTGVPQVPVPAAIWLLGSALAGLATVRRRRAEADAVAA